MALPHPPVFDLLMIKIPGSSNLPQTNCLYPWRAQRLLISVLVGAQIDVPITGTAVQTSPTDETDGRLLKFGAFGLGGKDDSATRVDQALTPLPSGFFGGSGGGASVADWPSSDARYWPFIVANRRSGSGVWHQSHIHFSDNTLAVIRSNDSGATWGDVNFLFGTDNLLGTVSQSGGVPTGAVIERSTNSNGEYVRFADGTQICTHRIASSTSAAVTWTFPVAFTTWDSVVATVDSSSSAILAGASGSNSGADIFCLEYERGACRC